MDIISAVEQNVSAALAEDLGSGDLTARLVSAHDMAAASVISREPAILCGRPWFEACFLRLDLQCEIKWLVEEGAKIEPGQTLCGIRGNARALLTAERPALNFLQTLSATATVTRRYVEAVQDAQAAIMDTRKTIPGLRIAQKYAVRVGGGQNQRVGLYDGILIKENHILAAGGIRQALEQAFAIAPFGTPVQIEVENLEELWQAIEGGARLILLDNFTLPELAKAVRLADRRAVLEASGGITLANVKEVAQTGVDRISVGSLTKDIEAVDLSLRFEENQ